MGVATADERVLYSKRWLSYCDEVMKAAGRQVACEQEIESEVRRDTLSKIDDPQSVCFHCLNVITHRDKVRGCRGCQAAFYCSIDCLRAYRDEHKRVCGKEDPVCQSTVTVLVTIWLTQSLLLQMGPENYFSTVASTEKDARQLAEELGITLPTTRAHFRGILWVVLPLEVTFRR